MRQKYASFFAWILINKKIMRLVTNQNCSNIRNCNILHHFLLLIADGIVYQRVTFRRL
jgi:hypothetical protein